MGEYDGCPLLLITITMDLYIRADFTNQPQYHIDFARGTIAHSRAASRGQTNRLFKDQDLGGTLKHLTYPQAANFYKKNRTAEFYLQYLRALALNEVERVAQQATPAYITNHRRVFERTTNTLDYPVAQNTTIGFVRSALDRQKLVDYMTKLTGESLRFGQAHGVPENRAQRKEIVINQLREIAFAK